MGLVNAGLPGNWTATDPFFRTEKQAQDLEMATTAGAHDGFSKYSTKGTVLEPEMTKRKGQIPWDSVCVEIDLPL